MITEMSSKVYIRDGRAPIPVNESISKVMSANKDRNTKPELILRKALWEDGITGYRVHWKKASGRPDIAFPGKKVAIFVNGCYWHRCPKCDLPLPKNNVEFWKNKFVRNIERDKEKTKALHSAGWMVLTVWECEIKSDIVGCVKKVENLLGLGLDPKNSNVKFESSK